MKPRNVAQLHSTLLCKCYHRFYLAFSQQKTHTSLNTFDWKWRGSCSSKLITSCSIFFSQLFISAHTCYCLAVLTVLGLQQNHPHLFLPLAHTIKIHTSRKQQLTTLSFLYCTNQSVMAGMTGSIKYVFHSSLWNETFLQKLPAVGD